MYADDISIYVMVSAPLKIELLFKRTKLILCNWSTQWCFIKSFDECEFYTAEVAIYRHFKYKVLAHDKSKFI